MNILDIQKMKAEGTKLTMVTCYDYSFARIIAQTGIDIVLVGDSVAMVVHGHPTTLHATTEMMSLHTAAVARGVPNKFLITDLPFPKHRQGIPEAMSCVDALMKAGAQAVKIEGCEGHEDVVRHIVGSGIPVMGHLGLLPQSVNRLGGYRVQGRDNKSHERLLDQALSLEAAGCFSVVLECVPATIAGEITKRLRIPTIGIGAGPQVDGQVLVLHDLLGMTMDLQPRFVRRFLNGADRIAEALNTFHDEVKRGMFPAEKESYE
ncbi:MAG: 3-methyl-2-oxobutanoate hydroxymethyltransferase [Ignavibacteriales bacterium]|nr:3-methyl-2-oxobutanoate hydroxymethyltransferase [Ignavibacteriales bacterium]